ncbi:hypothetical protein B0H17DRAFT_906614, partial [Mycena rosella]
TDGEGVERNWSWLNMATWSISVMGPGSHEDTIDDFCGFSNWKKVVALGESMLCLSVLWEGHKVELLEWEASVKAWEQDHDLPCPYDYPEEDGLSMDEVRLQIAEEEHAR